MAGPTRVFAPPDYSCPVDFKDLARSNKDFRDCLSSNRGSFDFKDAEHLRCLTKAILLRDFGLQLYLPANRLCPPVPIRWLYAHWIQNLIDATRPSAGSQVGIAGLDVGVGASCIYPLLTCASRPDWTMYGTDIDDTNYQHAVHNVTVNDMQDKITLRRTSQDDPLIPLDALGVQVLDFTMCNPPFFATKQEAAATFLKGQQPFAACTGAEIEMITPGGEVSYVRRMIVESSSLKDKVQWYTVQLGKLSSLYTIVQALKDVGCNNWAVNVLQPGGQTLRWVVGWSWMPWRAPDRVARHKSLIGIHLQPEPNERELFDSMPLDPQQAILDAFDGLPVKVGVTRNGSEQMRSKVSTTAIWMNSPVWSRSERRKRERAARQGGNEDNVGAYDHTGAAGEYGTWMAVVVVETPGKQSSHSRYRVSVRWVKGTDRATFESFCGMLKTKLHQSTS